LSARFDYARQAPGARPVRLPLDLRPGTSGHRSGWPHALEDLGRVRAPRDLVLDDFIERTFQHDESDRTWQEPWVGIFHHVADLPAWLDPSAPPQVIFARARFVKSLPHLRGAIALSTEHAAWLRSQLPGVPVLTVKHPTDVTPERFSFDAWRRDGNRRVAQVGWYARNSRAIYQLPAPPGTRKIHLFDDKPWIRAAMARVAANAPSRTRPETGAVEIWDYVDAPAYDRLLATSVVLAEYFAVAASNTVIECIARTTPILINRLPALEEYLGPDYPLFFDDLAMAGRHLADLARIEAAHHHLAGMDRSWLSGEAFAGTIETFLARL